MPTENDPPRDRPWDRGGRDRDDDRPRRRDDDDDRDDREDDRPRRRRYEDDDDYDRPRRRGGAKTEGGNGLAIAGLILGILAFCTGITALPGLICSGLALTKPTGRGMAIAGLILNILGGLVMVGGMFYAITKVRSAAVRMTDQNNMKQIGLGMHSEYDTNGFGLSQYARDSTGRVQTGSSFRVWILPYIEQGALYKRYDLSQPWDGPTNRSVSNTPLKVYTSPYDGPEPSANTPYRVYVGGGAIFSEEDRKGVKLTSITDGTANTILLVHAAEYVPWAEPRELRYSPNSPLPRIGHTAQPEGSNVLFADGSVRFIRTTVSERTMRALITRAEGEVIGADF
jgi:prepilin-type processing-associated H-X9-DG protein